MNVLIDGEIVLYGTVGEDFWGAGFTGLDVLAALTELGRGTDVTVRINSPGGFVDEGIAIFNALTAHRGRVTVSIDAVAASAASVIAMAGDEVIMRTGSLMMIHDPSVVTFGDILEHQKSLAYLQATAAGIADIYAQKTGRPVDEIRAEMQSETWLTAEEAVAGGFADRIDAANSNDPAAFNYRLYAAAPERMVALADERKWSARPLARAAKGNPKQQRTKAMSDSKEKTVKTAEPADPPAADKTGTDPAAGGNVVDFNDAGARAAMAYVREVTDLCALAGVPDKAMAFIDSKAAVADVRKQLLEARASADAAREVGGGILPNADAGKAKSWDRAVDRVNQRLG